MEFSGTFELDDVTREEVWLALSDPYMIKAALPGCAFLVPTDGDPSFETLAATHSGTEDPPILPEATPEEVAERAFEEGQQYAALVEIGVGSVKPSFETIVTISEREFPRMAATGEGSAANSSFELSASMELTETDGGVTVDWAAEADIFGRIAQIGSRVIDPVANRVVNQFFDNVADRLTAVGSTADDGERTRMRDRIRDLL